MATQKKGCGCLVSSLVLFIIGISIAVFAGLSVYNSGKELVDDVQQDTEFTTPNGIEFSSTENSDITIWLTDVKTKPTDKISIKLVDLETGETYTAITPESKVEINELLLIGTFKSQPNKNYKITAAGLDDGSVIKVINIPEDVVMSMASKGLVAIIGGGIFIVLSLVCGIIGLIKYFSSNKDPVA